MFDPFGITPGTESDQVWTDWYKENTDPGARQTQGRDFGFQKTIVMPPRPPVNVLGKVSLEKAERVEIHFTMHRFNEAETDLVPLEAEYFGEHNPRMGVTASIPDYGTSSYFFLDGLYQQLGEQVIAVVVPDVFYRDPDSCIYTPVSIRCLAETLHEQGFYLVKIFNTHKTDKKIDPEEGDKITVTVRWSRNPGDYPPLSDADREKVRILLTESLWAELYVWDNLRTDIPTVMAHCRFLLDGEKYQPTFNLVQDNGIVQLVSLVDESQVAA
jgi:hypothetical protein